MADRAPRGHAGNRTAIVFAVFLIGLVLHVLPSRAGDASPTPPLLRLSFNAEAGYFDGLLADPEAIGVVELTTSPFVLLGPTVRLRRTGLLAPRGRDHLQVDLEAMLGEYSRDAIGPDEDLRGYLRYQAALAPALLAEANLSMIRFRRHEFPLFDVNWPEASARLARILRTHWLVSGEIAYAHPAYPGREIVGGGHQEDDRLELTASLLRSSGRNRYAVFHGSWVSVSSNDALAVHDGPLGEIEAGLGSLGGLDLSTSILLSDRRYRDYPVLRVSATDTIDTGDSRSDRTWELTLSADRPVSRRLSLFWQLLWVRQTSNIPALEFHQTRLSGGIRVDFWQAGSEHGTSPDAGHGAPAGELQLAPVVTAEGVRFRVLAPGAKRVAVVGGFNAWDPNRNLLDGPDPQGRWEITLSIGPGTWRYSFVVDGRWTRPEDAPRYEDDGFGGENGILDVEPVSGDARP